MITDFLSREESRAHYEKGTEFQIGRIEMVSNTGTYLDTPFHRYPEGYDLAGLAPKRAANLEAVCIRIEEGDEIRPEALKGLEVTGRAVLFHTGWDTHWGSDRYGHPDHPLSPKRQQNRWSIKGCIGRNRLG